MDVSPTADEPTETAAMADDDLINPTPQKIQLWLDHWQDEGDAAFLYGVLAESELDKDRADVYRRLADVEKRHVQMWRQVLEQYGGDVGSFRPTLRARILAWVGRRFGSKFLLPLLLAEEGREMKGYLGEYQAEPTGHASTTALQLAKESADHALTLGSLAGVKGEPWHRVRSGGFLRNVVYGFNDGLTANFGLVMGVVGASLEPNVVLISGGVGLIADALSMGSSGYLAAKSEREVYAHEIDMERDELRLMPEAEVEELQLIYEAKGMAQQAARVAAKAVMDDPKRALAEKVREELGISDAVMSPLREGWVTGTATALGAFIPILTFLFLSYTAAIWTSFLISMAAHFAVGAARSIFTGRSIFRSGLDMFLVGLGVALAAYLMGDLVTRLL